MRLENLHRQNVLTSKYLFDDLISGGLLTGTLGTSNFWFDVKVDIKALHFDVGFGIKSISDQNANSNSNGLLSQEASARWPKPKGMVAPGLLSTNMTNTISF